MARGRGGEQGWGDARGRRRGGRGWGGCVVGEKGEGGRGYARGGGREEDGGTREEEDMGWVGARVRVQARGGGEGVLFSDIKWVNNLEVERQSRNRAAVNCRKLPSSCFQLSQLYTASIFKKNWCEKSPV